jgi:hypothetical protein
MTPATPPKKKETPRAMARPPAYEINGTLGRARAMANIINSLVVAPSVLVYVCLVLSGYVPFRPFDTLVADLRGHDAAMGHLSAQRAELDRGIAAHLARLVEAAERVDRRARVTECAAIRDDLLRQRCFDVR